MKYTYFLVAKPGAEPAMSNAERRIDTRAGGGPDL